MDIYGIRNMKSVDFEHGKMINEADVVRIISDKLGTRQLLMRGGRDSLGSAYRGYIGAGQAYIAPYSGRYGRGYICCTNMEQSTRYMNVCYYVQEED